MKMEKLGGTDISGRIRQHDEGYLSTPKATPVSTWDHWATLRGRASYVFAYDIEQQYSRFHRQRRREKTLDIVPAYRGLIYIDQDTKMVTKITEIPYDMPDSFSRPRNVELRSTTTSPRSATANFLLPLKSGELVQEHSFSQQERDRVPAISQVRHREHHQVRDSRAAP